MYNGIGLQTARGSGTNGYVQTNKFFIRPKTTKNPADNKGFGPDQGTAGLGKKANKAILEHDRKRQIELKLAVLEDKLTDQGYTDAEIAEKLMEARAVLEAVDAAASEEGVVAVEKNVSDTQTHQIAARKERQLETFRAALGISLPEDNAEKQLGLADFENDDEKLRHHKKGSSDADGEYEEGEILHKNEDVEAKFGRQMENSVSEKTFDKKGHRSLSNKQGEKVDYKHKKQGQSKKRKNKEKRRAYSSTDTESDSDSEDDSPVDTKGTHRSQRKSKKSMSSSSERSTSDSDDSGGAHGRRGQGRQLHKYKKHEQGKKQARKKKHASESSNSDTESEKANETDSDDETSRKYRYEKAKKNETKISDRRDDDQVEKHQKGRSDKYVKSSKRRDADSDSDVDTKTKRGLGKSDRSKPNMNDDSDYSSDDSGIKNLRRGSDKLEKAYKRHDSDSDSDIKRKDTYEKSRRVESKINNDSDSDNSEKEYRRKGSEEFVKAPKRHDVDGDFDNKGRSSSYKMKEVGRHVTRGRHDSEDDEPVVKAPKRHDVDDDLDNYGRSSSHKMKEVGRHVKKGRHDSEDDEPVEKAKRFETDRVQDKDRDDEKHKDAVRGRNKGDEHRRKHVEVTDDHDSRRPRRDTSRNDDLEHIHDVTGGQREDAEYSRNHVRAVDEQEDRKHRQNEREHSDRWHSDRWLGDDSSRGQRREEKEYRRKHEDESDYIRQKKDEELGIGRGGRREEDDNGNEKSGRREEDGYGRRNDRDRDSSKRARYEDRSPSDRRHRDHAHYNEDRWR